MATLFSFLLPPHPTPPTATPLCPICPPDSLELLLTHSIGQLTAGNKAAVYNAHAVRWQLPFLALSSLLVRSSNTKHQPTNSSVQPTHQGNSAAFVMGGPVDNEHCRRTRDALDASCSR
eukprot:TRINITY_DN9042_c0_g1_i1.p2 TRINITY_DN9042_c0_g1~~TRINITY_DN9042_c0_g1_i1.p2  ORF type:complete len:119 (-),score=15.16 TRINITY_DN9042_c0_g1_i1:376-732(-)